MIHTAKGFSPVNEAEVDVFLELCCFFYDLMGAVNLISGSPAFSKTSLTISEFSVHVLLKPNLMDFEHYLASIISAGLLQHHLLGFEIAQLESHYLH